MKKKGPQVKSTSPPAPSAQHHQQQQYIHTHTHTPSYSQTLGIIIIYRDIYTLSVCVYTHRGHKLFASFIHYLMSHNKSCLSSAA